MSFWQDRLDQVEDIKKRFEPGLEKDLSCLRLPVDHPRRKQFEQLHEFINAQLRGSVRNFVELKAIVNDPTTLVERRMENGLEIMAFSSYTDEGGQQGYRVLRDAQTFFQRLPLDVGTSLERDLNICLERSRFIFRRFKANLMRKLSDG